jgi:integrase
VATPIGASGALGGSTRPADAQRRAADVPGRPDRAEIQRGDRVAIVEGKTFDDLADHWIDDKTNKNILTLPTTMLHKGCELGWLTAVPKITKPRIAINWRDFHYLRSREGIDRFLAAARMEGDDVFALYAVAVFNGMRAGEIAALERGDVNLDQRIITVGRSFSGPTKSDAVRRVPVLDALLPILREWKLKHPGRLVFTNRDGRMHGKGARIFQEVLSRVLVRAKIERVRRGKLRPRSPSTACATRSRASG